MREHVPVGVLLQITPRPGVRYLVLGVALIAAWDAGYFFLEGFGPDGFAHIPGATERETLLREAELQVAFEDETFAEETSTPEDFTEAHSATSMLDARRRVLAAIVRRQGQGAFRQALLDAYDGRCAVTGCNVEATLEAAHIVPYRGPQSNQLANGLLLRADIHTLFDLGYLAIDSSTMCIRLAPELSDTAYSPLDGTRLRLPADGRARPSIEALNQHRLWTGL
jgi:putative restriction endonuclease